MLTFLKKIFTWWNRDTFGTRIKTILFGKLIGSDEYGNKYYQNKKGKRWVIYANEIDASKIPVEWYSWIHFMPNKIENIHKLEKATFKKQQLVTIKFIYILVNMRMVKLEKSLLILVKRES